MPSLLLIVALLCWSVPPSAWAGSVVFNFGGPPLTLTTNAKQDSKLQRLLDEQNAVRAGASPPLPPVTLEQYVQQVLIEELKRLNDNAVVIETNDFCTHYQALSQTQKDQIIAAGGNNSPCP
jgi:hypothetical protein